MPAVAGMFAAWILLDGRLIELQQAASGDITTA